MMMYSAGKRKKKPIVVVSIAIFVFIFLILFNSKLYSKTAGAVHIIAYPFWKAHVGIWNVTAGVRSVFSSKYELEQEVQKLRQENTDLNTKMFLYTILADENTELKEMHNRKGEEEIIIAGILVWPSQSLYDIITIDAGTQDGIIVGKKAFVGGSVLVGEVIEVHAKTSKIKLYSTNSTSITGLIGSTDTAIEMIGRGNGTFEILIPKDIKIEEGSYIKVPGIHTHVVAVIKKIISDPRDPVEKIIAISPVNINQTRFVEVEK